MTTYIESIDRHPDTTYGTHFDIVTFRGDGQRMVGILFSERGDIAILDTEELLAGTIKFVEDCYEDDLRQAVDEYWGYKEE